MKTIYLAGPLFSKTERTWINLIKRHITRLAADNGFDIKIINPQEFIYDKEIAELGETAKYEIFNRCKSHLDSVDILVAVLDGSQVDDGTAWEIGYFYGHKGYGHKILGIRTDFRKAGESSGAVVNAMIECSCDVIVDSVEKMVKVLDGWLGCVGEGRWG